MAFFDVDTDKCTKDNVCIKVCVANIIKANHETGYPEIDEKKSSRCIACGHCVAYCPHNACSITSLDAEKFIDVDQALLPSPAATDMLLRSRRSVRRYRKEELSRGTVKELIDVASAAPTAENFQKVAWAVITGRETMRKISDKMAGLVSEISKDKSNPHSAISRAMAMAYRAGNDVFLRGAPNMAIVLTPKGHEWPEDGAVSLTYMELAAHARKIGSCWAGYYVQMAREHEELRILAGIGEEWYIAGALLLGKPLFKNTKKSPPRKERRIIWT